MESNLTQIVIIGASGDLTARKLVPGLLGNARAGAFKGPVQVVGVSRSDLDDASWREELSGWIDEDAMEDWEAFKERVFYQRGDALADEGVAGLLERLDALCEAEGATPERTGRLFYLALAPKLFAPAVRALSARGGLTCRPDPCEGWRRLVVEKPFGVDFESARALNQDLLEHVREEQLYRIDHYLGKETVQNLIALRFQNAIFEPLWNNKHIESVEITVAETVGVEGGRGAYYDGSGALRDMVQNHVLQVLALVAMEAPNSMRAEDVRGEKVKVFRALGQMTHEEVARDVVRARYAATDDHVGYLEEEGVAPDSTTETYVAIRAKIHNWRWSGVPFLLRTGKALTRRYTEVVLRFRTPPLDLLNGPPVGEACPLRPNTMRIQIQPDEGVRMGILVKQPGAGMLMRPTTLKFDYDDLEAGDTAPAYQRLLLDAVEGNATLFIRGDEVEEAWRFVDAIREGWEANAEELAEYPVGSMGPESADALFHGCEGTWGDGVRDS